MINKDIFAYLEEKYENYKQPITNISMCLSTQNPMVVDERQVYNFDIITRELFDSKHLPTSVDGIDIRDGIVELIEFKTGFKQRITKDNFDEDKMKCEKQIIYVRNIKNCFLIIKKEKLKN